MLDTCKNGHERNQFNTKMRKSARNGEFYPECLVCKRERKRKENLTPEQIEARRKKGTEWARKRYGYKARVPSNRPKPMAPRPICPHGEQFKKDCKKCKSVWNKNREQTSRKEWLSNPVTRALRTERQTEWQRVNRYGIVVPEAWPIPGEPYAALILTKDQQAADLVFEQAIEENGNGLCFGLDGEKRWMDDFDEEPASPEYAEWLCTGCPLIEACGIRAAAYKPAQGVFAGKSWKNGKALILK